MIPLSVECTIAQNPMSFKCGGCVYQEQEVSWAFLIGGPHMKSHYIKQELILIKSSYKNQQQSQYWYS